MMIMHTELAELVEKSEINYMIDRMNAIKERPDDPEGIEIRTIGRSTAFYSKTMPWGLFNNVKGSIEKDRIDEIIRFYEERDRKFEFQIIPGKADQEVMKLLAERGFYQSGFHTSLYGEPRAIELEMDEDMHIRELREDELDVYAEIHCLGTGLPIAGKTSVASNNRVLFERSGWRYYIGFVHDKPAAVAVMHMEENMASLTFATTLPEYRNRGLQKLLLQRRIDEAYRNNCRLVVGQCAYCSPSHRNMERVGLKIGYTRSTWTKL